MIAVSFSFGFLSRGFVSDFSSASVHKRKAVGLGGIFFKSENPKKLKEWYQRHLGLNTDEYGTQFEWRYATDSSTKGSTLWAPFNKTTKYFGPSTKEFMINYRVLDMNLLFADLKADTIQILDSIEDTEYGKFLHIMDPEGNKIELWEPYDEVYDKFVSAVTK